MSTLNVTSIQNPAAPQANLSLNADGTVTLPVFTGAAAPPLFQAGTLWFDTAGPTLLVRNPGNTAWVSAGGGGGGTVTGVTATAPLVSSGGAAPNLTINAATTGALGAVQIGTNIDVTTGTISIKNASATDKGVIEIATLAEAATGTDATRALTPSTGVPKDAATMTGAAILPSGTDAQRAAIATPVVGMTRFNTTSNYEEVYTGVAGGWQKLAYAAPAPSGLSDLTLSNGQVLPVSGTYNNITLPVGATVTTLAFSNLTAFGTVTLSGTIDVRNRGYIAPTSLDGDTSRDGQGPGAGGSGNSQGGYANSFEFLIGSSGASGTSGPGGGGGSSIGGRAAGGVKFVSYGSISVTSTFSFLGSGTAGSNSGDSGGGGGGSGGLFFLDSTSITLAAGATINVSGGNGSSGITSGGGGGGGGGGWVVLNGASITNAATVVKNGGTAGSNAGSTWRSGGGGSFAGSGGLGSLNGSAPSAGSSGYLSVNGILS